MRILVTGHRGYIGTVAVPLFQSHGHQVTGLDSGLYERCTFGPMLGEEPPALCKDIRDVTLDDLAGFEAVVHLAGLSNDPLGDLNPALTDEINHRATVRLAKLAKESGVERFVFSSSCSNYGASGDNWLDETASFNPVTPYGQSKVAAEFGILPLADDNFCVTCLRSATAYGVSPRIRFDLVLNNLVAWASTSGLVYLKSDGTPWRPIVHIEDISRAFLCVLEAPTDLVNGEAYNVGITSENYQMRDLANVVVEVVPGSRVEYAPDAGPDKRCYRVDCSKIRDTFPDFQPQWNLRKGAVEIYDAICQLGLQENEFENERFSRIQHLKFLIGNGILGEDLRYREFEGVS
ncbi:MAG: SDR family oxidoreductase [Hyphomicrobiales bacterium]|nr:SDR family oxidoreductase [Hyphomicrobiales bacterium]